MKRESDPRLVCNSQEEVEKGMTTTARYSIGAVDAWASPCLPGYAQRFPDEFKHIFRLYGSIERFENGITVDQMLAEMDEAGVEMVVLSSFYYQGVEIAGNEMVADLVKRYPDRFVIGAGTLDPRDKPMEVVRRVRYLVEELGMRAIRLEPYAYGNGMWAPPPSDKMYWPVYVACAELRVPVCIQVGHTGPLLPSECGRPIYLDEVALAFPELTIIGCHLGQPWHEEMMTLAWKHPNVYVETSARPANRWPESFVEFVRTWGQDKVIWATDYPLLSFKRCRDDVEALDLPSEVKSKLLRDNAIRAFRINATSKRWEGRGDGL